MEIVFKLKIKESFFYFPAGNVAGSLNTFWNKIKKQKNISNKKEKQRYVFLVVPEVQDMNVQRQIVAQFRILEDHLFEILFHSVCILFNCVSFLLPNIFRHDNCPIAPTQNIDPCFYFLHKVKVSLTNIYLSITVCCFSPCERFPCYMNAYRCKFKTLLGT